ncbi:MAG: NDP-sugar synthase [Porphyromonadaceae bacterium]|nr:NDP-sugar synthase [Porphyromonadaceae bacterium]
MEYAIIAAGEGSRLAQEGVKAPKPLVSVGGEPLIDRLCRIFSENRASRIHIIINEEHLEVRHHVEALGRRFPIRLVIKSTPSSMHSFYELASGIEGEKFCLTTVDPIFDEQEFSRYISLFSQENSLDGYMAVTGFVDDEKPLYVETDSRQFITAFSDTPTPLTRYVSGGIYAFSRKVLPYLIQGVNQGLSRMRNFQRFLIEKGLTLKAHPFSCIIDIDHAADIAKAESFLHTCKHVRP